MAESLKEAVVRVLAEEVAPALNMDGTELEVIGVDDGVVRLRFTGACGACPSSVMSLVMGIEQELKSRLPQVEYLEAVP